MAKGHHSHPATWPSVAAEPWTECTCHEYISRDATPDTAFPVAVLNPIDPRQRAAALQTLLDHLQAHEALDAYNALLDAFIPLAPQPVDNPVENPGA